MAVVKKPHCFCTWTSSVFNINRHSDKQQCAGGGAQNRTEGSASTAEAEPDHYQVYHTPVLGESSSDSYKRVSLHVSRVDFEAQLLLQ